MITDQDYKIDQLKEVVDQHSTQLGESDKRIEFLLKLVFILLAIICAIPTSFILIWILNSGPDPVSLLALVVSTLTLISSSTLSFTEVRKRIIRELKNKGILND